MGKSVRECLSLDGWIDRVKRALNNSRVDGRDGRACARNWNEWHAVVNNL